MKSYISLNKIFQFLIGLYIGLHIGQKRPTAWTEKHVMNPEPRKIIIGIYSNAENMKTRGEAIYNTWFKRQTGANLNI